MDGIGLFLFADRIRKKKGGMTMRKRIIAAALKSLYGGGADADGGICGGR